MLLIIGASACGGSNPLPGSLAALVDSPVGAAAAGKPYVCEPKPDDLASPPPQIPALRAADGSTPSITIPDDSGLTPVCDDPDELPIPLAIQAPKGWPSASSSLLPEEFMPPVKRADRRLATLSQKGPGLLRPLAAATVYRHATMFYTSETLGAGYFVDVDVPAVDDSGHSLNEIALRKSMGGSLTAVELGWRVAPAPWPRGYGDGANPQPRLFVFVWLNGIPLCYDACGWQQFSPTVVPGFTKLNAGTSAYAGWKLHEGNWWAWWNNQWLGYYPKELFAWLGGFPNARVQWFGEVIEELGSPSWNKMGSGDPYFDPAASSMQWPCTILASAPTFCTNVAIPSNMMTAGYPYTLEGSPPAVAGTHRYGGPKW